MLGSTYQHGRCDGRPRRERDPKHDADDCVGPEVVAEGHEERTDGSPRESEEGHEEGVNFWMVGDSPGHNPAAGVEEPNQ